MQMVKYKLALASLLATGTIMAPAHAQDAKAFMDRANEVYAEHVQCGVDLALAIPANQNAGPEKSARFQEAFTQYMNRLLGVAAATGREQPEVLSAIRTEVAEFATRSKSTDLSEAQRKELNDASSARTKACLVSIGYQAS
jgi:hypothetical protein